MDAGIASEDNIKWLRENSYPYIVVSRKHHREFDENAAVVVKQDDDCTVKAQKVVDLENDEVLLYCHSTKREKKEKAINDRFATRFEDAVSTLESGLYKKGCLKKYDKVLEKIGRLKQQYAKAAKHYKIKISKMKKVEMLSIFFGHAKRLRRQKTVCLAYIVSEQPIWRWTRPFYGVHIQC